MIAANFLLENKYSEELYNDFASKMPIIDYHNHLSPLELNEDKVFTNITELWIKGDHYKYRAMRALGINETYITGNASDADKFAKWAYAVPYTMRNPLFHWTHLELSRYFDINTMLSENNATAVYETVNGLLANPNYSTRGLMTKMNVEMLCTTDDPTDDLNHHIALAKTNFTTTVKMAFRPDKSILINNEGYNDYITLLSEVCGFTINTYDQLCDALSARINYFHNNGCTICDHGLEQLYAIEYTENEVKSIFKSKREGGTISTTEAQKFQMALLQFLAEQYHAKGWVQQFHLGALRNNNKRMLATLGPDTGWDSIGDFSQARGLSTFLDALDTKNKLTKTIIYNLNPADNEVFATMIGNYNDGTVKGKVQWGSGWWFLDQKDGMTKQLNTLSNMGVLSTFVGMLTDSRSFLSFPRHEYFRRILCNLLGTEIQNGELPNDIQWIGKLVEDICYHNAKDYFKV